MCTAQLELQLDNGSGSGRPLGCDSQTSITAIILTHSMSLLEKVKSWMGSPDMHGSMFNIQLENSCRSTALDMPK